jgi:hypothetical protein
MSSGSSLTSKLYDKIIKMISKSHETIPLRHPKDLFLVKIKWLLGTPALRISLN